MRIKVKMCLILIILLVIALFPIARLEAAGVTVTEETRIYWTKGYIEATGKAVPPSNIQHEGQAKLMAREGAIVMARARMVERLEGVCIEGETTVLNLMANQRVYQEFEGFIRGAMIVEGSEKWDSDMEIYEVKLRKPIDEMYKIIYREKKERFRTEPPTRKTDYTGLVIDTTGLDLTPQVMFKLLDEDGRTIYSAAQAHYQPAVDGGLASYSMTVQSAKDDPRTGDNPLVVKAVDVSGDYDTDIVLSREDGQKVHERLDKTKVFTEARVIVVSD